MDYTGIVLPPKTARLLTYVGMHWDGKIIPIMVTHGEFDKVREAILVHKHPQIVVYRNPTDFILKLRQWLRWINIEDAIAEEHCDKAFEPTKQFFISIAPMEPPPTGKVPVNSSRVGTEGQ